MKALRFQAGVLSIENVPIPNRAHEVLVRVSKSGICNTDLEIVRGYAGFEGTLGHEFVGTVETAEADPGSTGKRVVGEINAGCGLCTNCLLGDSRHCPRRTVLGILGRDGAHAEFLRLPRRNLIEVPENVSDRQAVFAEPLAAAIGITERVSVEPETRVTVIGDGKLGLLCALSLALRSPYVALVGKHPSKLAIAESVGIHGIALESLDNSHKSQADIVVEASGSPSGLTLAVELVKPRGKIVLKSTYEGSSVWPGPAVVVNEITIVGSRCGRMEPALRILAEGSIDVEQLIEDEYPLSDAVAAMEHAKRRGSLKILLNP